MGKNSEEQKEETERLVRRMKNGDRDAFEMLFRMHYQKQYRYAKSILKDSYAADDVVQESFSSALKSVGQLAEPKVFTAWLTRVTHSRCIDWLRQETGSQKISPLYVHDEESEAEEYRALLGTGASPGDPADSGIENMEIRKAVSLLKPNYRNVIILKYFYGMKEREIAKSLEIPLGTVKSRLSKGKKYLGISLAEYRL
jgi:RNA polymerase sigma-70 factor (ECF subfamily)